MKPRHAALLGCVALVTCTSEPTKVDDTSGLAPGLATITTEAYTTRLYALADDSTQGRLAPSPELAKAAAWVASEFAAAGLRPAGTNGGWYQSFVMQDQFGDPATVSNVVGILQGSGSGLAEQAVIFTSHMDHIGVLGISSRCHPSNALPADSICNGADDNASGTVGVIMLARAFAALHPRPARTLVFAVMTGEEEGLYGSSFYAAHPVVPLASTVADFNLDMIARNPPDTAEIIGQYTSSLGGLVDSVAAANPALGLATRNLNGPWQYSSDHWPFVAAGIPALFFCSDTDPEYHTTADNPDRVDPAGATRLVKLAFLTAWRTANASARPTAAAPLP